MVGLPINGSALIHKRNKQKIETKLKNNAVYYFNRKIKKIYNNKFLYANKALP
jgi:hypothetical protein